MHIMRFYFEGQIGAHGHQTHLYIFRQDLTVSMVSVSFRISEETSVMKQLWFSFEWMHVLDLTADTFYRIYWDHYYKVYFYKFIYDKKNVL